ncbi:hypothetical protein K8352_11780 [Flavobacteriaceae bacterium F89]|uniref:Uncharacterized protein n=1 Tax=Cerina litoralis TaxID=2874477 RepID=A0AAE3JTE1_9FLAO|nr:hypothetical protein [Cerina litoralis]MCG2461432.1 hypothetical protein [Cerina litoralis]
MKKTAVLVILFIFPIVAYIFFASGVNHFGKLPILTERVGNIEDISPAETLEDKITILGFLGRDVAHKKGNAFNLNEKIYKPFYRFTDFQFVMVMPMGTEDEVADLKAELGALGEDAEKWKFIFGNEQQILDLFNSLKTDLSLDDDLSTPYVFIIDKTGNLRGRNDDEDEGTKYGFNATSVAELNNKMTDDVKIVLAEYRMALKKNKAIEK